MSYAHSGPNWVEITNDPATRVIPGVGKQLVPADPQPEGANGTVYVEAPDDVTLPPGWEDHASGAAKAAMGVALILEGLPPGGVKVLGKSITDINGKPSRIWITEPLSLADLRTTKLVEAEAVYAAKLAAGYPVTLGGNAETLQCRNDHDRTNWLGLLIGAQTAVALGQGTANYPIKIRCTSNAEYTVTNDAAAALMLGLLGWAGGTMSAWWGVKDAITGAGNAPTLNAINLETGYP